jgi:CDP-glycerol glycerophosphotransferase (TagB/SpsB family)
MIAGIARRVSVVASYALSHFTRRNPRLWVFGNLRGFRDNPRYLAEHVAHSYPELEVWWIARADREAEAARGAGLHVAMRGQAGARIQRRAGAVFVSNGFADLEPAHLGGAYVVDLRHGQGTKKILLDMPDPRLRASSPIVRGVARLRRWYIRRRLAQIDMIVAPGELERDRYVTAFGGSPERIRVLGSPRFDVIHGGEAYERVVGGDLRHELGLAGSEQVVLWLPTWRETGDSWVPALDPAVLDQGLDGTSGLLLVKPHPYSDHAAFADRLPRHPRVRLLTDDAVDVNCLLRVTNVLVTDYSSAVFDYALLERPIQFFVPDMNEYRGGEGLQPEFEAMLREHAHRDWPSLLAAVADSLRGDAEPTIARRIRKESRNVDSPGSNDRITQAVVRSLDLPSH